MCIYIGTVFGLKVEMFVNVKEPFVKFGVTKTAPAVVFLLITVLCFVSDCRSDNIEKENTDNNPYEFHIGGVLSSNASESYFKQTIEVTYNVFMCTFIVLRDEKREKWCVILVQVPMWSMKVDATETRTYF